MKINQEFNGFSIGGLFTIGSLLSILTFIIPIFTVFPGAIIESFFSQIIDNEPYSNVGIATIVTLLVLLIFSLTAFLIKSRKSIRTNNQVFVFMVLQYFIVHTLGFYIYWAKVLNFRSDGQLALGALSSFPFSSFAFFFIGILIDSVKKKPSS